MNARYAVYYIPEPGTALAALGSALLGRDSETGAEMGMEAPCNNSMDARRYGLHATLKAPFFLRPGQSEQDLLEAAARFASSRAIVILPRLELARIGSFFALVPAAQTPPELAALEQLNALAAQAVTFFEPFRAAPSERELARRRPQNLSPRQQELLAAWGYPYVFDQYRFHITLTDKITDTHTAQPLEHALQEHFRPALGQPPPVASICICKQTLPGPDPSANIGREPFTLRERIRLGRFFK